MSRASGALPPAGLGMDANRPIRLLAIVGLGYVVDSLSAVLSQGSSTDVATFTGIGEFLFALWLVIWGRRITLSKSGRDDPSQPRRFHEDPAGVAQ
jgi:hypothetical protein